jgi:hypothetical protein
LVAFVATVVFGVSTGLLISVAFGMFTTVLRQQLATIAVIGSIFWFSLYFFIFSHIFSGREPNTNLYHDLKDDRDQIQGEIREVSGVKILQFNAPLTFLNIERFRQGLLEKCWFHFLFILK